VRHMNEDAFWAVVSAVSPSFAARRQGGRADEARDVREAIAYADSNGLYFPFVSRLVEDGIEIPREESRRWPAERERLARFRRSLRVLDAASSRTGSAYAVIKTIRTIPNLPRDVDILVREEDRRRWLDALGQAGFALRYRSAAEVSLEMRDAIRVDVYSRIEYLGRAFLDPAYLWGSIRAERTHAEEHPGLTDEAEFLLNSCHDIFGHGSLTLMDFLDLIALRQRVDVSRCLDLATAAGWGHVLRLWLDRLDRLERLIRDERGPPRFPLRHGRRFLWECVEALADPPQGRRERLAIGLSFLWDDASDLSEESGLGGAMRRSPQVRRLVNVAGHRLRTLRGDRKAAMPSFRDEGG